MKKILLILTSVTLFISLTHASQLSIDEKLDVDNVGISSSITSVSFSDIQTSYGTFAAYTSFTGKSFDNSSLEYVDSFSEKLVDISGSWLGSYKRFYFFSKCGVQDVSDFGSSVSATITTAWHIPILEKSVVSLSYSSKLFDASIFALHHKLRRNGVTLEYNYKNNANEFVLFSDLYSVSATSGDLLIDYTEDITATTMFDNYAMYTFPVTDNGLFLIGLLTSYSNASANLNITVQDAYTIDEYYDENGNSVEAENVAAVTMSYPYSTPQNKTVFSTVLTKHLQFGQFTWMTSKLTLPLFSMNSTTNEYYTGNTNGNGNGKGQSSYRTFGIASLVFSSSITFPCMLQSKMNIMYQYEQKPYTSYGYYDFTNSYINNEIDINISWGF